MQDYYTKYMTKKVPSSILIFAATARLGRPMAEYLTKVAPSVKLRLSTSSEAKVAQLQQQFPDAEVVVSSYWDLQSLERAVDGMEGIFCSTAMRTDETLAMGNLVKAINTSGTLVHLIRQVGLTPDMNRNRITDEIREDGKGLPVQHPIARDILDESGLPVTFLNCAATFINNFIYRMGPALRRERKLIWPERRVPVMDTDEIGEIAARLMLSTDRRYLGQFITINNGHDFPQFAETAKVMSEVWGESITYDGSREAFFTEYQGKIPDNMLNLLWKFFDYERSIEVAWSLTDSAERILGRKPKTLREWLIENKENVLGSA